MRSPHKEGACHAPGRRSDRHRCQTGRRPRRCRRDPTANRTEHPMKLTIFAATGGIGRQTLEQAVAAGHDVTAVVRNPSKLSGEAVPIVTADLAAADPAALESAVAGADAVLS